jgi:hypothetical protein
MENDAVEAAGEFDRPRDSVVVDLQTPPAVGFLADVKLLARRLKQPAAQLKKFGAPA